MAVVLAGALVGALPPSCAPADPASSPAPVETAQSDPGWLSRRADRLWQAVALRLLERARLEHARLGAALDEASAALPVPDRPARERDGDLAVRGTYGHLPEVHADQGFGYILPAPPSAPTRVSWYGLAREGRALLDQLDRFQTGLGNWNALAPDARARRFPELAGPWEALGARLAAASRHARYLETWRTQLEAQWLASRRSGALPFAYLLVGALHRKNGEGAAVLELLRDSLRPTRVMKRPFLPERAEGPIALPIATDVQDRRFLAEVEGALATHWNQSSWARAQSAPPVFRIEWTRLPVNADFAAGKASLDEHLARFPADRAAMTTGGLSTYVRGQALVLGPGRIHPRTIAHELGHLLGFGDCYFRTLSGHGALGLAVLEWDNPVYPDDLMCDNVAGAARAEAW